MTGALGPMSERVEPLPRHVRALIGLSLVIVTAQIVATAAGTAWAGYLQWVAMPALVAALIAGGGIADRRGRWWLAGLVLSWGGDTLGRWGFLVLLGCFLLAHVCYLVALWPMRRHRLARRRAALAYGVLGAAGAAVIAPAAGPVLAGPVVLYAATLTFMALLASACGRVGVVGGLLFMVSDLTLGLGEFVIDLPTAMQTTLVMGTYVPAQALLLIGVLRLLRGSPHRAA